MVLLCFVAIDLNRHPFHWTVPGQCLRAIRNRCGNILGEVECLRSAHAVSPSLVVRRCITIRSCGQLTMLRMQARIPVQADAAVHRTSITPRV